MKCLQEKYLRVSFIFQTFASGTNKTFLTHGQIDSKKLMPLINIRHKIDYLHLTSFIYYISKLQCPSVKIVIPLQENMFYDS